MKIPVLEAKRHEIKQALSGYLPDYKAQVEQMEINKDFSLPVKSLNFIADSLKIQLRLNKDLDLSKEFFSLYGQISGI